MNPKIWVTVLFSTAIVRIGYAGSVFPPEFEF